MNAKVTQLDIPLEHGGERSDYAPCNQLLNTYVTLPAWLVVTLLDDLENADEEAFQFSGLMGLTWDEFRSKLLKLVQ